MKETLTIRTASRDEFQEIYAWMEKQFHAGELKYLTTMEHLREQNRYEVYGLWSGETLLAYALFAFTSDMRYALLDYYAVLPQYQDCGWGGKFLNLLSQELSCQAILLEVEDPKYAPNAAEKAHFERRIQFYERNHCLHTPVNLNLWGFDYVIMTLPIAAQPPAIEIHTALEEIYRLFFPPEEYVPNVHFRADVNQK